MPRKQDVLIRALVAGGQVRAFALDSTRLCERARKIQQSWPAATAALGRLMSAAVMMAAAMKDGERISLRIEGDGEIKTVFAQGYPDGRVRGFLFNPQVNPPVNSKGKLAVGQAVGQNGELFVIRDLGMSEPYIGRVPLRTGEIGDELADYYLYSEQQPTAVGLGVLVGKDLRVLAAGGYLLQPLPGVASEVLDKLEENAAKLLNPSSYIFAHRDPAMMLNELLAGLDWQETDVIIPRYSCGCSRAKSRKALDVLGTDELQNMHDNEQGAEVNCDFCGRRYNFSQTDISRQIEKRAK